MQLGVSVIRPAAANHLLAVVRRVEIQDIFWFDTKARVTSWA